MNTELWKAQLDHVDEKHELAHKRLRVELTEMETRLTGLAASVAQLRINAESPVDAGRIAVPFRLVLLIIGAVVTIIGTVYASTSSIHVQMQSVADQLRSQQEVEQERSVTVKETLQDVQRKQTMQELEIQEVKEMILKGRR